MANHDYVIDNGTGSAVRTDINSALQAIGTSNSGNSAPSTIVGAGMQWWDSDGNTLYIRNTANNAWIACGGDSVAGTLSTAAQTNITSLGTLTTLTVDNVVINGTNIGHTSDTDAIAISSGGVVTMNQIPVFSAGINVSGGTIAGTLATAAQGNVTSLGTLSALTVSGGQVHIQDATRELKIGTSGYILDHESGGHLAFRSNSDSERVRFLDNGNVAIGATSASTKLAVTGTGLVTGDFNLGSVGAAGGTRGKLAFGGASGVADGWGIDNQTGNYLRFKADSTASAYVIIDNVGKVGIGVAPSEALDLSGAARNIRLNDNSYIQASSSNTHMALGGDLVKWNTGGAERARIVNSGMAIGSTTATWPLNVKCSGNYGALFGTNASTQLRLSDSAVQAFSDNSTVSQLNLQGAGGNVGIGVGQATRVGITVNPNDTEAKLDLGSGENSGNTRKLLITNVGNSRFGLGAASNEGRIFYADDQDIRFKTLTRDGNFTVSEKAVMDRNGRLGIGDSVNTAATKLNIKNDGDQLYLQQGNADNGWIMECRNADGYLGFQRREGSPANYTRMSITTAGEVLIGTTSDSGAYLLQVNSQIYATNATIATSDRKFKDNIKPLVGAFETVKRLRPSTFTFKPNQDKNFSEEVQVGFIAQEIQEDLNDTEYKESVVQDCVDHLGLAYEKLIPVLTAALQEAITKIETLEGKIAQLEGN